MVSASLFEKLQLVDQKSILIQGLPSSIEKLFAKLSYAKNVTPLLKSRKIDFVLVFAINQSQLLNIMKEILPAMHTNTKLWVAFPKTTSKIVSDLNREGAWDYFTEQGFDNEESIEVDNMWNASRFKKNENFIVKAENVEAVKERIELKGIEFEKKLVVLPIELERVFVKQKNLKDFFSTLNHIQQREYLSFIDSAKRADTRRRRLDTVIEKLQNGKKTPTEK
ncbi:MAG: YdeI/OmpD-associated family protein [Chitinophagaceae bacterium]|jgi:hypothetical protein